MDGEAGDLFEDAVHRRAALAALAEGTLHRRDLEERLDVSKTTCHRIIRSFDDHGLVRRTDDGYRLSELGEAVAGELDRAARNVATARDLAPLLAAFEPVDVSLDVSLFTDATVTRARPDDPYPPVSRFMDLLRGSSTLRSLDRTSIAPLHVEEMFDLVFDHGLEIEAIYPASVVDKLLSEYPEQHRRAADLGRVTYRVHDDITFGLSVFDDRVGLRAYDVETGALRLLVDVGSPEALAWAESVFEGYREQARTPEGLPDPMVETERRL